ncbi:hypothetical protein SDC9_137014 [bioreactor metagenome]|uniref:Uncharacterized protein n=1 Tax=bioreactor metagenome TaxID=1076179 RepID=A0A645DKS8_9ZZZZ
MSSLETCNVEFVTFQTCRCLLFVILEGNVGIQPSGTTNIKFTLIFGIQVYEDITFEDTGFQPSGTCHTCLFVHSKEGLYRAMHHILVFQDSHGYSQPHPVICSQGGAVGIYPTVNNTGFDRILFKIMDFVTVLLGHHIYMCLQDNSFTILQAGRCRFPDDNVAELVFDSLKTQVFPEFFQEKDSLTLFFGWSRNLRKRVKMVPYPCGL